jgi:peptidoglycan/LPS O-acetylase OafA/YrhL
VTVVRGEPGALRHYAMVLVAVMTLCATQAPLGRLLPPLAWTLCLAAQMRPDVFGLSHANRMLRSRNARYLGAISYCVYLVNEPILKLTSGVLSRVADGNAIVFTLLWLPVATAVPIGVAGWLHRHVEVPWVRWGRSFADRGVQKAP